MVGNKSDLEGERTVTHEMAQDLAAEFSIKCSETSAKNNLNIMQIFESLAKQIISQVKKMDDDGINEQKHVGYIISNQNESPE